MLELEVLLNRARMDREEPSGSLTTVRTIWIKRWYQLTEILQNFYSMLEKWKGNPFDNRNCKQ